MNQAYGPVGYVNAPKPRARYSQPVTPEMSQMMLRDDDTLSVKISPIERAKNMCTHKYPGKSEIALVESGRDEIGQIVTCRVCGESFHIIMDDPKAIATDLQKTCDHLIDIMQSSKTLYLDIPEDFATEFFQIMTLIDRVPKVYEKGFKNFSQYDYTNQPQGVYPGMNSFQTVNQFIGGAAMGGINPMMSQPYNPGFQPQYPPAGYQQPVYYPQHDAYGNPINPQQAPAYPQAPVYQQPQPAQTPQYGNAMPMGPGAPMPGENPFMYNAPPAPQAPAAGVNPVAPGQPQPPVTQTGDVVQNKAFSV